MLTHTYSGLLLHLLRGDTAFHTSCISDLRPFQRMVTETKQAFFRFMMSLARGQFTCSSFPALAFVLRLRVVL